MSGIVADVIGAKRKQSDARAEANKQALETLLGLLRVCKKTTELLDVRDHIAKDELLDALTVGEVNVLRVLADEDPQRFS